MVRTAVAAAARWFTPGSLPIGHQRVGLELACSLLPSPDTVRGVEGGVFGERHRSGYGHSRMLLYLHGGGYCIGSPRTHRHLVARLASGLDAEAFVPAYRLAPEHPYPAGLEDSIAAYSSLIERFDEVTVAGESAGGGLTLALAIHARDQVLRPPTALGLICPWLDLVGPHADTGDPVLTVSRLEHWKAAYARPDQRADPRVSPALADLTGLPPIVLHSAGHDPLLADAEKLAAKVDLEHRRFPGQFHGFHAFVGVLADAAHAVDELAASLRTHSSHDTHGSIVA